jgi:hypothetical protein
MAAIIASPGNPFAVEWPSPLGSYFAAYDNLSDAVEALAYAGRKPLCVIEGLNGDVRDVTDAVLAEVDLYRQDVAEQRAHDAGTRRLT